MKDIIQKIYNYIKENYNEELLIQPSSFCENNIYIKAKQYDLNIGIEEPEEDHYLYGKTNYVLDFDYNANKKFRSELNYHGGGHSETFNEDNYSNIDEFLAEFCEKRTQKQLSLF